MNLVDAMCEHLRQHQVTEKVNKKDQLGNELTVGCKVVYSQSNHSVTPLVGVVQTVADETVTIVTSTKRSIVRHHFEVIVYKGTNDG